MNKTRTKQLRTSTMNATYGEGLTVAEKTEVRHSRKFKSIFRARKKNFNRERNIQSPRLRPSFRQWRFQQVAERKAYYEQHIKTETK
jgi:hypothetical protein